MLNWMGYKLRHVQKVKPLKKIKGTNSIFENVKKINAESDACESSVRISIDAKAIFKLGELSRRGKSRGKSVVKAHDKDMAISGKLVPFGILEVLSGVFTIIFGKSRETSDFIADYLEQWWEELKEHYPHIRELVINLDNGPALSGVRTHFLKRLVEFADRHQLNNPPGLLSAVSQQVQRRGTRLGDSGKLLERSFADRCRNGNRVGKDDDLERDFADRQSS